MPKNYPSPTVSVVIIGRNEGERLARCLTSVRSADWRGVSYDIWYVDSKSTDQSLRVANEAGATCLLLDDSSPCAAKARNLGWQAARGEFILFLDGDTQLANGFVKAALNALADARLCAAWGHRRESDPQQSVYTRVLDLDWVYPIGRSQYFGGDVLVRREALQQVDGFDPTLKAGEEPEMCARLRAHGWQIEHLDTPMTSHDLAVRSLRAYVLRCYRSGMAYAEVAHRMRLMGDALWQREAVRDFRHGVLYLAYPVVLAVTFYLNVFAGIFLMVFAASVVTRSAWRCRNKAAGDWMLAWQYALHSHIQKIPALFGQLAWRRAQANHREIALVEYKDDDACARRTGFSTKSFLALCLGPAAWLRRVVMQRASKLWHFTNLKEALAYRLDASNVILGSVQVHGTGRVAFGRNALVYPGVYLETQGPGQIIIGDNVVLSTGVHLVAFERIVIESNCMVGEYSSIRDANHRASTTAMRESGHDTASIHLHSNVWLGRGVTVLKGVTIGTNSIVGANAVVTKSLGDDSRAGGVPARPLS